MQIIDIQNNGLGDVILGCWIIESARQQNKMIQVNPRNHRAVTQILSMPDENITENSGGNWTQMEESGFNHELKEAHKTKRNRFDFWSRSVGLENLKPVRPVYGNNEDADCWARQEWEKMCHKDAPKVVMLPEATRVTRTWPILYWIDLNNRIKENYNTCVLTLDGGIARQFDTYHYWGLDLFKLAALLRQADIVISGDSGGAHLAATLKTHVIALQGPTIGDVVFGHDEFVHPLSVSKTQVDCVACNFSKEKGYWNNCNNGCQALYMLNPRAVVNKMEEVLKEKLEVSKLVFH